MKARTRAIISFSILVVLLFGLYYFSDWFSKTTGFALGEDDKVAMAQCITFSGGSLYVSSTCPECAEQIEFFGKTASRFLNIIECKAIEECDNILVLPAWRIKGEYHYGFRNFIELEKISGCDAERELAEFFPKK